MKLVRVRKSTGTINAQAEHDRTPNQTWDDTTFGFLSFGGGERNTSDMRVVATLEDAIMIVEHQAQRGNLRAKRILGSINRIKRLEAAKTATPD